MARVLSLDPGMTIGYAVIGGGLPVLSGSRQLNGGAREMGITGRHAERLVREWLLEHRPTNIAFASPFVGQRGGRPISPDSIRPLMGLLTVFEMIADELRIPCAEYDEPQARRAFMDGVPRKSKDIKTAVIAACRARGWPARDDHAADALCIGSWALECLEPETAFETTPLFAGGAPCATPGPTPKSKR